MDQGYEQALHRLINKHYDLEEFKMLCFQLDIEYDNLLGNGKTNKIREFVKRLSRHGRIAELDAKVRLERPHVFWPDMDADYPVNHIPANDRSLTRFILPIIVVLLVAGFSFWGLQTFRGRMPSTSPEEPLALADNKPTVATPLPQETPTQQQIVIVLATQEQADADPTATPTATLTPTPTSTSTPTPTPDYGNGVVIEIGQSVEGVPIEAIKFGNGFKNVILVGGLHAGYAPNTVEVAYEAISYFKDNLGQIPSDITLYIIPNANPDSADAVGQLAGRLNARGVDLNRNWDCSWSPDAKILGDTVANSGGSEAFSEPEVLAVLNFIESKSPVAVAFWFASRLAQGYVSPGACEAASDFSVPLSKIVATGADYTSIQNDIVAPNETLTGDAVISLNRRNVRAIAISLPSFRETQWEQNLGGILAMFAYLTDVEVTPVAPQTVVPTLDNPALCLPDPGPRWGTTLYADHQDWLGCPLSMESRPQGYYQLYEKGLMVFREMADEPDLVYVLFYKENQYAVYEVTEELPEAESDYLHKGAFGYLWANRTLLRDKIGDPIEAEGVATDFAVQDFSQGTIFYFLENRANNYVLFEKLESWTATGG